MLFLFYNYNAYSIETKYYFFIHEDQLSSCNQEILPIIKLTNPEIDKNLNLVIIGNNNKSNFDFSKNFNINIILDTNNFLASKFGIYSVPSIIKIDGNKIDTSFHLPYISTFGIEQQFIVKEIDLSVDISTIDHFIEYNNYFIFCDNIYKNIIIYNKEIRITKWISLFELFGDISKQFTDNELIKIADIIKFESLVIDIEKVSTQGIIVSCLVADSLSIIKNEDGTARSSVLNLYKLNIFDLNNLQYYMTKGNKTTLVSKKIKFNNDGVSFHLNGNSYDFANFLFNEKNIIDYNIKEFNYGNVDIVVYYKKAKYKGNVADEVVNINYYDNNKLIKVDKILLPFCFNNINDYYPVSFDGEKVKYFLQAGDKKWFEIDQLINLK